MIRTLLVDDEPLARDRIRNLLVQHTDFSLIGEAKNGREAVKIIEKKGPDLIFLDVQMPAMDGFKVLENLEHPPILVFCTAFEQYALKAFDVEASDYLLKPFDDERFEQTIERIRQKFKERSSSDLREKLLSLVHSHDRKSLPYIEEITFVENGFERKIVLDDVLYIQSDGNYVQFFVQKDHRPILYRSTLSSLEDSINSENFLRIHRSIIIQKAAVENCRYLSASEYEFTMRNQQVLVSSKAFKTAIQENFS